MCFFAILVYPMWCFDTHWSSFVSIQPDRFGFSCKNTSTRLNSYRTRVPFGCYLFTQVAQPNTLLSPANRFSSTLISSSETRDIIPVRPWNQPGRHITTYILEGAFENVESFSRWNTASERVTMSKYFRVSSPLVESREDMNFPTNLKAQSKAVKSAFSTRPVLVSVLAQFQYFE
jgi:hypothetical protein